MTKIGGVMDLPNSPIKKVTECKNCGSVSVQFWNDAYNKSYTKDEWSFILDSGIEALKKILEPLSNDPKFFFD